MQDIKDTISLIGFFTVLVMVYSIPYMFRAVKSKKRLSPPEILFLFLYCASGFGIASWLIGVIYTGAFTGAESAISYAWTNWGWYILIIPASLIVISALIRFKRRR